MCSRNSLHGGELVRGVCKRVGGDGALLIFEGGFTITSNSNNTSSGLNRNNVTYRYLALC